MPDPFQKVQKGDPVTFSATAWNAMLDAARLAKEGILHDSADLTTTRGGVIVKVKNESGSALDRASVLGLGSPIFTPGSDPNPFLREVTFRGVVPDETYLGEFCILLEPAAINQVVRAYLAGVCAVKIDVIDPDYRRADVDPGSTARLAQNGIGTAQILWLETDEAYYGYETGEMWGVVRLGCAPVNGIAVLNSNVYGEAYGVGGSADGIVYRMDGLMPVTTNIPITLVNISSEKEVTALALVQYKPIGRYAVIDWADCGHLNPYDGPYYA